MNHNKGHSILESFAKIALAIFSVLVGIVFIINFSSEIVSGVWLVILKDWKSIGIGIFFSIGMVFAYSLVSLPSTGLVILFEKLAEKKKKVLPAILSFLNSLYTNAIIALWVMGMFVYFLDRAGEKSKIPYLLWGYGTMMSPLSYMAHKNDEEVTPGNIPSLIFAQLCYLICVAFYFLPEHRGPWLLYSIIIIGVAFSFIPPMLFLITMPKEKDRFGESAQLPL